MIISCTNLQLYSKYTNGPAGQFSTDEGFITVVDIPITLGSTSGQAAVSAVTGLSSNGLSPPVGMVPFDDHSCSQENSLSCDPFPISSEQVIKHGADDILISGSLSEIGTHEIAKWEGSAPPPHGGSPDRGRNGFGNTMPDAIDKEWYRSTEEEALYVAPQAGSQEASQGKGRGTHLLKKEHKSLEALTRIQLSDQEPVVGCCYSSMGRGCGRYCLRLGIQLKVY